MSKSLKVAGQEPPEWVLLRYDCTSCEALERQRALAAPPGPDGKQQKPNPEAWHVDQVVPKADAEALMAAQQTSAADDWDDDNWK